jgi:hypothetical protein
VLARLLEAGPYVVPGINLLPFFRRPRVEIVLVDV